MLEPWGESPPLAEKRTPFWQRAGFLDHSFWAIKYEERQLYASGEDLSREASKSGLPEYSAKNERLENADVVVWYNFGLTHLPRVEDWPVMSSVRSGFSLIPHHFSGESDRTGSNGREMTAGWSMPLK